MNTKRKKILGFLITVFIIFGFVVYFWIHGIVKKVFVKDKSGVGNTSSIGQDIENKKPFNIILLGYGGGMHDGAYLTDTIIMVHVDPQQQKIVLVSIPRDIWIKIPTNGTDGNYWKINAAYELGLDDADYPNKLDLFKGSDGGGHLAEYIVSQVTGLKINYFVGMDFAGFTHTIDTLGGVNINVEIAFDDYQYPITGKENDLCGHSQSELPMLTAKATQSAVETIFPCRYEHLHFNAGLQHMDGATALKYVRSRHSLQDGTDFGRAKRQRNLLVAVKKQIFSASFIPRIVPFMSSLGDDLRTDMTLDDVRSLIQNAGTLNKYQISTFALTDQNFLINTFSSDGQAILETKDGIDNWLSVHNWIANLIGSKSQSVSAVVKIENATHMVGLAELALNRLKNQNIQVIGTTSQANHIQQTTKITVYDKNINPNELDKIKKEFGISGITYKNSTENGFNVLITVGNDYNLKESKNS